MILNTHEWIDSDKKLYKMISDIEATGKSNIEMAEMAFERIAVLYNLPKMPNDIPEIEDKYEAEEDFKERRSLFEEFTYLKYLSDGDEDIKGLIILAAYYVLNGYAIDLSFVAKKGFGENPIPSNCQIGIRGDGIYGEVVFPDLEQKSWFSLGCIKNSILLLR